MEVVDDDKGDGGVLRGNRGWGGRELGWGEGGGMMDIDIRFLEENRDGGGNGGGVLMMEVGGRDFSVVKGGEGGERRDDNVL